MSDLDARLEANRAAVDELIASAASTAGRWTTPVAPGKWSPAQLTEHVALSLEEGAKVIAEQPSKLPGIPFFLRPLARWFVFDRVNRSGRFPKSKTARDMNPASGPADPAAARERLLAACEVFETQARARGDASIRSPAFGAVTVADYVKFVETHTRHHRTQLGV